MHSLGVIPRYVINSPIRRKKGGKLRLVKNKDNMLKEYLEEYLYKDMIERVKRTQNLNVNLKETQNIQKEIDKIKKPQCV